ncbi:unnamed protein product, partial [marine sediment metagenome]
NTSFMAASSALQTFQDETLLLKLEDQEHPYRRRQGEIKTAVMWSQRNLGCSLIQFLTLYWNPSQVSNPIVVYVGSAPGLTIPLISDLLPEITFHLYDPKPFGIKGSDKIRIHTGKQGWFNDTTARQWSNNQNVFFVSDIRNVDFGKVTGFKLEEAIQKDMELQKRWYLIINPVKSM